MTNRTVTAVPGVLAGHWTHESRTTGVTVLLFPDGARGAVFVPGSAPGSRELGVLAPRHLAPHVHGVCLAGGSAFGLAAADGVLAVLAERGIGLPTPGGVVPLVPAAILYDLHTAKVKPDRDAGAAAARAAASTPLEEGRCGAGAGARVGSGTTRSAPGGVGQWAQALGASTVAALVAVNALGRVRDPSSGRVVAGGELSREAPAIGEQTTLAVVVTDVPLDKAAADVVARMASAGLARTIEPVFSPFDGDTVFVMSTGAGTPAAPAALVELGHAAAECVAAATVRAVQPAV